MVASNYATLRFKVKALKLCWVKRLCCNDNATWTILPQVFFLNAPSLTFCLAEIMFYHQN